MTRFLLALPCVLLLACGDDADDKPNPPGPQDQGAGDDSGVPGDGGGDDGGSTDGGGSDGGDGGGTDGGSDDGGTDSGTTDGGSDGGGDDGGDDGGTDSGGGDGGGDGGTDLECPDGVVCVERFPATLTGTTTGAGSDRFDSYSCSPGTDESGPEVLYRVTLPDDGFLALELTESGMASGADIDIHLLDSRDADDCIDRGHWRAGSLLTAGDYWVVADTWVSSGGDAKDGSYTLRMGLTTVDDLVGDGMDRDVAEDALYAYDVAWRGGDADHFAYAITDFSMHAGLERQWVLDMAAGSVEWNLYVAHGENSASSADDAIADSFSNTNNSHQSSLGMMAASETYTGTYGYSMRLDGLEPGYNDNVRTRAIVVHPWQGSRDSYVDYWGAAANTWGCPAIDDRISEDVIDFLANGGLLFFHYPDGDWSRRSTYLP